MIYHSSSYLGLLLSFEEYVLSAAVIVGRYLFLYIQAISEYLLANFYRLLCLGRYYFVIFSLITDFPVLTISELLLMIIKLLTLLLSFVLNVSGMLWVVSTENVEPSGLLRLKITGLL